MMQWTIKPGHSSDELGFIPDFIKETDPRPVSQQINERYDHGGGWCPLGGFKMLPDGRLKYPGDPMLNIIAETKLRDEVIRFYEASFVAIIQPDGSFEASRLD